MLTRRSLVLVVSLLLAAAIGWSVWLTYQTATDLRQAQASASEYRRAVAAQDVLRRAAAVTDLQTAALSARDRTDGIWWGAMTRIPFLGDDAAGVRDLSASLDVVASRALRPLGELIDELPEVSQDGQIDLERIRLLGPTVGGARDAISTAVRLVQPGSSAGFAGVLRSRYDDFVNTVSELETGLQSAETAVEVLPSMLGEVRPRRYLLIFENNAEIRATGGLPGSWALIEASDGELKMGLQGSASDFAVNEEPIGDISPAERILFGEEMGRYFQDPNFTPDFPRAAGIFKEFWDKEYPSKKIDGILSIDVVGLSYLLEGLGPVQSDGLTLTADSVVDQLLSEVYLKSDPKEQDRIFRDAARAVFEAAAGGPGDGVAFVEGLSRAAREGRFRVAPFVPPEMQALAGTQVVGDLLGDDGETPHVDIALNDFSASKMSYYLRYRTEVKSLSCRDGIQDLAATMTLGQTIKGSDAAALPTYVTGYGDSGSPRGSQLVRVHIFAPFGGTIRDVKIDGSNVSMPSVVMFRGRPAITLTVLIASLQDVVVSFQMTTGEGQGRDGVVESTPSVVPGDSIDGFESSCGGPS